MTEPVKAKGVPQYVIDKLDLPDLPNDRWYYKVTREDFTGYPLIQIKRKGLIFSYRVTEYLRVIPLDVALCDVSLDELKAAYRRGAAQLLAELELDMKGTCVDELWAKP